MVPVPVCGPASVTQGLPLVPPVNPSHSNRSWDGLCCDVQPVQVIGSARPGSR